MMMLDVVSATILTERVFVELNMQPSPNPDEAKSRTISFLKFFENLQTS